jgi:hypothetical protein
MTLIQSAPTELPPLDSVTSMISPNNPHVHHLPTLILLRMIFPKTQKRDLVSDKEETKW